jgi:hypothetical protein
MVEQTVLRPNSKKNKKICANVSDFEFFLMNINMKAKKKEFT